MVHGETLKLADFGLAVFLPRARLLVEKCGTAAFMAPEQHKLPRHSRGYSYPCDIWAGGVCMYMVLCEGRHPFLSGDSLDERSLVHGILNFSDGFFGFGGSRFHEAARQLCKRMVEPSPERRVSAEDPCAIRGWAEMAYLSAKVVLTRRLWNLQQPSRYPQCLHQGRTLDRLHAH